MYKNKAYIIRTKTNLHAGSGNTNFGIVDNEVQRDTITNLPIIQASSLKGSLKDHFDDWIEDAKRKEEEKELSISKHFTKLFGDENSQGLVRFIDAKLLLLPLRSNKKPFYHVTSVENLENMKKLLKDFDIELDLDLTALPKNESFVVGDDKDVIVEDVKCKSKTINIDAIKKFFGIKNLAIFNDEDFNEAVTNLPVIARNNLEGEGNLWYEEVVPRESIFFTVFNYYDNFNDQGADRRGKTDKSVYKKQIKKFENRLLKDTIQIGANASIGYGLCDFFPLGAKDE